MNFTTAAVRFCNPAEENNDWVIVKHHCIVKQIKNQQMHQGQGADTSELEK